MNNRPNWPVVIYVTLVTVMVVLWMHCPMSRG